MNEDSNRFSLWFSIRHYRFNSVFVRNFLLIVLLFLVPIMAIGLFFYRFSTEVIEDQMLSRSSYEAVRYRDITDAYLLQIQHLVLNLATDPDVNAFLFESKENLAASFELFDTVRDMEKLGRLVRAIGHIDSIYIYSINNEHVLTLDGAQPAESHSDREWIDAFRENRDVRGIWFLPRDASDDRAFLSVLWNIYLYDRLDGTMVINVDLRELGRVIQSEDPGEVTMTLQDDRGRVLYTNDPGGESGFEVEGNAESSRIVRAGPRTAAVSTVRSDLFHYNLRTVLPMSQFYEKLQEMRSVLISIVALGVVGSLILSFVVSVKVFEPLRNILRFVDEQQAYPDRPMKSAEVKYIADSISRIIVSEHEAEEELRKRVSLLKRAQAAALQAQINPHFLYNTLDSIKWTAMVLTKGKNAASEMISNLSKLLRYSLESEDSMATIGEEVGHATLYLDILKWRYKETFRVIETVDPAVVDSRTVRLSLQPILENAVYHGIKPKKTPGTIHITGFARDSQIVVEVADDGVGLSPWEIERLNASMSEDFLVDKRHIGLRNVNQRIKLVFGETYGISVRANTPSGLSVSMALPAAE